MNSVNLRSAYLLEKQIEREATAKMSKYVSNTALLFTKLIMVMALSLLVLITLVVSSPAIEGHLFPVVKNMEFIRDGDTYTVHGEKVRSCKFISIQGLVQTSSGIEKATFDFLEPNNPTSRSVGKQSFGKWRINPPGKLIAIYSTHECHAIWNTTTTLIKDSAANTLGGN